MTAMEPATTVPSATATAVQLDRVTVVFPDGTHGLDDVSLRVGSGEVLALVGPSGSGKTTLLRSLAGFIRPGSGRIAVAGRTVASAERFIPPEERRLGMVFQQHAIWPHLSVGGNVEYPLRQRRVPRAERRRRVDEVLALVGLPGSAKRDPAELSGGQRQRIALARAIVDRPGALLLDEAFSALDEPLRMRLRLEVRRMSKDLGLTVVHVTHDRQEALAIADRVAVLADGRLQQIAAPADLLTAPASPLVAAFLDDATLLEGVLDGDRFHPDRLPTSIPVALGPGSPRGAGGCRGTLAVLPAAVDLAVVDHAASDAAPAHVTAALFGSPAHTVTVDWNGVEFRARIAGRLPQQGEPVDVRIGSGLFFPEG
jgi:iron(III) transport system ATP-binding protein